MKTGWTIYKLSVTAALLLGLGLSAAPAQAKNVEIAPVLGFRVGGQFPDTAADERYEFDEDVAGGGVLSIALDESSWIDLSWTHWETVLRPEDPNSSLTVFDMEVDELQVGGHYMWDKGPLKPILRGTLGVTRLAPVFPETDDEWSFSFSLGTGFKSYFNKHVGLRLDARVLGTTLSSSPKFCVTDNQCVDPKGTVLFHGEATLGLFFAF